MTVTGFSRLEDLIGIAIFDEEIPEKIKEYLDEMQGILNKLPTDDDSKYILNTMFNGTKHNQAVAQLEVMQEESNFMMTLRAALCNPEVQKQIKELMR